MGTWAQTVAIDSVSVTHKNDGLRRCYQDKSQQVFLHFFFNFFFLHLVIGTLLPGGGANLRMLKRLGGGV